MNPSRKKLNEAFLKIFEYHTNYATLKSESAYQSYKDALWIMFILSVVAVISAFTIGWMVSGFINRKLNQFSHEIFESSKMTFQTSQELTTSSSQLSEGATESAASLQETVSSLEELSSMVKLNSDHAKEANTLSQASLVSAESGEGEIRRLISAMNEMTNSSKKIEEIINVIDDIAFQTNLLALNAAVEAARAGEDGKGFAVVADAVRGLASRSSAAAKDINILIKESVSKTEEGGAIADKSAIVLKEILNSVKKVAELNSEIAAASNEQAHGIEQISKAMNHLDQAIQMNASSSQKVAKSASDMSLQSQSLSEVVGNLNKFIEGKTNTTDQHN